MAEVVQEKPKNVADQIRRVNIANIIKRLNAGKTLSAVEQKALEDHEASQESSTNGSGRFLGKKALAKELGVSLPKLRSALSRSSPPPPKPDEYGRYSVEEVRRDLEENTPRGLATENARKIRETMLSVELEDAKLDLAIKQGLYVEVSKISPVVAAVMMELTINLRQKFEQELPPLVKGKSVVEIQVIAGSMIDYVLTRFKQGHGALGKNIAA